MKKIGIFYGPEGGSVERVARKVYDAVGHDKADLHLVRDSDAGLVGSYVNIIFGISTVGRETWDAEFDRDDWDRFLPELDKVDFTNKVVALYGLGDQIGYSRHFVDALGALGSRLLEKNAEIVGHVATDDYQFEYSKGIFDGRFIGLPLDEDYEPHKTDERLERWLSQVIPQFK